MALDFEAHNFNTTIPTLDELIQEGIHINAFSKAGWVHNGIMSLARNCGVPVSREEFRSADSAHAKGLAAIGLEKILKRLKEGKTSTVSVEGGFKTGGEFHQILLVGYENSNFLYHEPAAEDESGAYRQVSEEKFLRHWRHLAIFVG